LASGAPRADGLDEVTPVLSAAVRARARALGLAVQVPYERAIDVPSVTAALAGEASASAREQNSAQQQLLSTDRARMDHALVHGFLSNESYWAAGMSEASFQRACAESLCFGVYAGRRQLAFARVVSDFARFAYLADVFVVKELRGRGLGKALVQEILQHPELVEIERWLLGTRDAHALYARFGFFPLPEGRYMLRAKTAVTLTQGR
jgi:GNAT superfamily N-acetyltransferase